MTSNRPVYSVSALGTPLRAAASTLVLVGLLCGSLPAWAEYSETFSFSGKSLYVGNLIGAVEVEGTSSSGFEVEVTVRGRDASAGSLDLESTSNRLMIVFPREDRFVYPELGRGSTTLSLRRYEGDSSLLRELVRAVTGRNIKVSGRGSGTELWADVVVRVPQGGSLEVEHGVGSIRANSVDGDLELDISSGGIEANRIAGRLVVDSGSGKIVLTDVDGDVEADTGSGSVLAQALRGETVSVDTGSGEVELHDVECRRLRVDTGSGSVRGTSVRTADATIDTGSGSVEIEMIDVESGDYEIDTGSGSITLLMPATASADVQADTGSGGISVDLPDIETLHRKRDEMRFRMGSGDARIRLDTGSGRIRVASLN